MATVDTSTLNVIDEIPCHTAQQMSEEEVNSIAQRLPWNYVEILMFCSDDQERIYEMYKHLKEKNK